MVFVCILFTFISNASSLTVNTIWTQENNIPENIQENEVKNLTQRLLGNRSSEFVLTVDPGLRPDNGNNKAVRKSRTVDGVTTINIVGSTGVAAA